MIRPAALLLDLDGTIVDSEPLHFEAHRIFLARHGIVPTSDELTGNIGRGDLAFYRGLMAGRGMPGDDAQAAAWVAGKTDVLMDLYRAGRLTLRPGVRGLIDRAVALNLPRAVVTSSERRLADLALTCTGLAAALPLRVVAEDVPRHKPDPLPYLAGARLVGVEPARCLAIEDSVSGVRSAKAAGCTVVGSSGIVADELLQQAGADAVLPDLAPVAGWL